MRKIQVEIEGVNTLVDDSLLEQKEDGNFYKYYNADFTQDAVKNIQDATEKAIAHYKSLYLEIIDTKLKELDYDSLATVKLWADDAIYGTEATKIITWYKGVIAKNYVLLDAGTFLTDSEYLAEINSVIF